MKTILAADLFCGAGGTSTGLRQACDLVIKAKLEAVESQIATFEEEFLAHIVMPNDHTVADLILPQIAESYKTGKMPKQLAAAPSDEPK